ncbi:hypothetical protein HDU96_003128 [Phlyctochytrium bullatum]|nr:hypothetical protein HDU96_003128 [Phlyctochytrium bullatum]
MGSDIECWRISYAKVSRSRDPLSDPNASTTIFTTSTPFNATTLEFLMEQLEPGSAYVFAVAAVNGCGESETSDFNEMIPIAESPVVTVLSPTSIKIKQEKVDLTNYSGPRIVGYKIELCTCDTVDSRPHIITMLLRPIGSAYAM